jgi:hypothetical protein
MNLDECKVILFDGFQPTPLLIRVMFTDALQTCMMMIIVIVVIKVWTSRSGPFLCKIGKPYDHNFGLAMDLVPVGMQSVNCSEMTSGSVFFQHDESSWVFHSEFCYLKLNIFARGSWLRHYATSRKVAVLIPNEVSGFFNIPNPSSRTMALESTQPLIEMSTRNLLVGKGPPARKPATSPPSVSQFFKENVGTSTSYNHMGLHGLLQG